MPKEFVSLVFEMLDRPPKLTVAPKLAIRLMAAVNPTMRAVDEALYQSEAAWMVDNRKFAQAFEASPTPHRQAIRRTLDWYQGSVIEEAR